MVPSSALSLSCCLHVHGHQSWLTLFCVGHRAMVTSMGFMICDATFLLLDFEVLVDFLPQDYIAVHCGAPAKT